MIKYVLTFLLLMAVSTIMAQKKSVITILSSSSIQGVKLNGVDVLKVYNAVFEQDYSTLQSDSAYFHQRENTFDAFGHVVITQGDTLHIYSDKLNYNGNSKIAILTDNVRMVDKDATLTTNYLTYNTATKIGTYTGGGKLVNKDNTLTSLNGYYFARSRDSYFRYNVRLLTPDALILTDTMRYNSGSKIAYFYGPTNIYGKKKAKDNDTLYTEDGLYNTNTEQAFFGKKNLYKQGTKTLHGDSMFYDRKKGYGRAVKNITFNDTEQKMTLKGNLGTYYKADERTVVSQNAYAVIVTEEKDTTKKDPAVERSERELKGKKPVKANAANTVAMKAAAGDVKTGNTEILDTLQRKLTSVKLQFPEKEDTAQIKKEVVKTINKGKQMGGLATVKLPVKAKKDSASEKKANKTALKNKPAVAPTIAKDTAKMKHDSIFMTADTLDTRITTYKDLKDLQEKIRLANIIDTNKKAPSIVYKKPVKYIEYSPPKWIVDTSYLRRNFFGAPKPRKEAPPKIVKQEAAKKLSQQDSLKKAAADPVYLQQKVVLSDTTRIRLLSAYHHAKIFKSDLQGKSDSVFYSTSDSTIHMFVQPILWTQGSQLSGDTINLQMKNKKLDNLEMFPSAFIANVEKKDSIHFNQVAGKKMRGFFKNDKLERMFVDGNSETIYFSRDSTGQVKEMHRSLSSRIRLNFKDGKITDVTFLSKPEHRYGPLDKFTEDDRILKGFLWKPKERPVSKESIIHPPIVEPAKINKDKQAGKAKSATGKSTGLQTGQDTSAAKPGNLRPPAASKTGKDSVAVKSSNPAVPLLAPKDTLSKQPAQKPPVIKAAKDSAATKPVGNKPGNQ